MRVVARFLTGAALASLISGAAKASAALIVPAYNSAPYGKSVFLDFDGDNTPTWGTYSPGVTSAYDIDGDPTTFSAQELENIQLIWQGVSEKFSPWRLNVTTVDPGHIQNLSTIKVVIGGDGSWAPPNVGGIAIHSSFAIAGFPNVAFVFPDNLGGGNPRYVAEASAHEAGHSFGLSHQSLYDASGNLLAEYNPGNAERAPIMGRSYFSTRGTWWNGPTEEGFRQLQDDMRLLGLTGVTLANDIGYRTDDHGDTHDVATPLTIGQDFSISGSGIIEYMTDADFFSFTTPGGSGRLVADVAPFASMLDLSLGLYDELGNLLAMSGTPSLGEVIDFTFAPGTYKLGVFSAGAYGDVGQYFISGTTVPEPAGTATVLALLASGLSRRRFR